ncbi:MAG: PAS domain-containing protein, partial [Krumholzibacteria bacterium]|nr:PAS domain-containing protein [Candidatus Krumholzibacteria bacterium]
MSTAPRILALTAAAALLLWLADAAVRAWVFGEGPLGRRILRPDALELYARLLAVLFLVLAGAAWSRRRHPAGSRRREPDTGQDSYRALVEASPDCVVVHADRRPLFANGRALAFFGRTDLAGLDTDLAFGLIDPGDQPRVDPEEARPGAAPAAV